MFILFCTCGTAGYDSPSDKGNSRKTKGLHEDDLFNGLHLIVMTKCNQFKDGSHRHPNSEEVGC